MKENIKIRFAQDGEGDEIHRLLFQRDADPYNTDFSRLHPYWLVAELEDKIIGCVMLQPGLPTGRLEDAVVDDTLSKIQRAKVFKLFLEYGVGVLKAGGAQFVEIFSPEAKPSWRKVLTRRGWKTLQPGRLMLYQAE